jgi:hypothetical protein
MINIIYYVICLLIFCELNKYGYALDIKNIQPVYHNYNSLRLKAKLLFFKKTTNLKNKAIELTTYQQHAYNISSDIEFAFQKLSNPTILDLPKNYSALVIDINSGIVLYRYNEHKKHNVKYITKLMIINTLIDYIQKNSLKLIDILNILKINNTAHNNTLNELYKLIFTLTDKDYYLLCTKLKHIVNDSYFDLTLIFNKMLSKLRINETYFSDIFDIQDDKINFCTIHDLAKLILMLLHKFYIDLSIDNNQYTFDGINVRQSTLYCTKDEIFLILFDNNKKILVLASGFDYIKQQSQMINSILKNVFIHKTEIDSQKNQRYLRKIIQEK